MDNIKKNFFKIVQVVSGAFGVLAGFPKNLFYKPQNMAEFKDACRIGYTYLSVFLIFMFIAAGITVYSGYGFLLIIIDIVGLILVGWRLNSLAAMQKQFQKLTCTTCQQMITYNKDMHYKILGTEWRVNSSKSATKSGEEAESGPVNIHAWGEQITHVQISCRCQKCGNVQCFDLDVTTGQCTKKAYSVSRYEATQVAMQLENQVRQVCHDVFEAHQYTQERYGVKVELYDLERKIKNFFDV